MFFIRKYSGLIEISLVVLVFTISLFYSGVSASEKDDTYARQAWELVGEIERDVRETAAQLGVRELDPIILETIRKTPRHEFVPRRQQKHAYENRPLPIGHGQTISQPYIVAIMTHLLNLKPEDKVLEVGTGSAYQAAILSPLVKQVNSIEIIKPLGEAAIERLARLGYKNVHVRLGDGYYGWPEEEPFDAIIVTAAASHVPPPLVKQLKPGGRMIVPVGSRFLMQQLLLIEKNAEGKVRSKQILPVTFVPLTGKH